MDESVSERWFHEPPPAAIYLNSLDLEPEVQKMIMQNLPESEVTVFIFSLGVTEQSAREFAINLNEWSTRNPRRPVRVHMNSTGGNVNDGLFLLEALDYLRGRGHHLTVAAHGRVASSSGWIMQRADRRVIGIHSWFHIHELTSSVSGTISAFRNELARMEQLEKQTFALLTSRTKKLTIEMIKEHVSGGRDWWLSAQEALEMGLVDALEETPVNFQAAQTVMS